METDALIARVPGAQWIPLLTSVAFLGATVLAVGVDAGTPLQRSVAALLPALFSLRLAAHARDLDVGDDVEAMGTVVGWTFGGVAVMGLVVFWFAFTDVVLGLSIPPGIATVTALAAGAVLGVLVGRYSVQARRQVEATTRMEVERELTRRQQERITLLNRILRHHARNAVNVVTMYAEALEPHVDEERREYVETIHEHGMEICETVDVIQEVAETLAGIGDLRERDAAAVVREELARARERFPRAEFVVDDLPATAPVRGDDLLERVVGAQLENAVEHSDRETPTVRVSLRADGDAVRLRVADDGPGIPDDEKPLVFDAGDRGVTTEGDGLDLFLVDAVVDRYGGGIAVEDADPRGAAFVTTLPGPDAAPASVDRADQPVDAAIRPA